VLQSIREYQKEDSFCKDLYFKAVQYDPASKHFKLVNGALVYHPSWTSAKHYVLPEALRPTVLEYFHGSMLSAQLGVNKMLSRIGKVLYWPHMMSKVGKFVMGCQDCQRAKPTQDSRVGLHSSEVVMRPLQRIFTCFFGPIVRSRRGTWP
jgi:hypothetical protein